MSEKGKTGALARSFNAARRLLTLAQKRKAIMMVVLSLVSSLVEVFGLASLVPIVVVCAEPGGVFKNKYFSVVYKALNFQSERSFLLSLLLLILVFFLLKSIFTSWINYIQGKFTSDVIYGIIDRQLNKFAGMNYLTFSELGSSKLINSTVYIPSGFLISILRPLIVLATEFIIALCIALGLLAYNWKLVVILVVVLVPPMVVTYRMIRVRAQRLQERINALWPVSITYLNDLFAGFLELRLARKQQQFKDGVLAAQSEAYQLEAKNFVYTLLPQKVIELAAISGVVVILGYSVLAGGDTSSLIALVGLFAAATYRLMPSLNRILTSVVSIKSTQHLIDDIESHADAESQQQVHPVQQQLHFERELELRGLTFTFPKSQQPALDEVSLVVHKGQKVGFIGSSGSGKTTLMNVLLRFLTEQSGQILVDGVPLGPQNIDSWHHLVGYVKQDTFLMNGSMRDNITLGEENPDEQRLAYSIEQASLKTFVDSLPDGVNTIVGERGSKLSGGQRQRIGIARALYKQTQVLILDEATSALDNETEREVNEAINGLSDSNLTIMIVAHRLTTLRECDRIYELSHGKLVAEHEYSQLLNRIK